MNQAESKSWIKSLNEETEHLHNEVEVAFRAGWMAGAADSNSPQDEQQKALEHDWRNYQIKRRIQ